MRTTKHRAVWDTWGNSTAAERLHRAVEQGPRHAYLLTGPHHIGKSHVALRFAASLLCRSTERSGEFCGGCSTCRRVLKGVHPDVTRFDLEWQASQDEGGSKNLSLNIKTVREIGRHVSLRPAESNWRVVVVDDVETMQEPAQEAFLKTLEEPPSYVVLLMLATDAELLLPTILSRCAIVPMVPATDALVTEALLDAGANEADAERIAVAVRGRVGLGLRAVEDASLLETLSEHVSEAVRWVGGDPYERMAEAYRLAEGFTSDREMVFDRVAAVEAAWRELMLSAHGVETIARHPVHHVGRLRGPDEGVAALRSIDRCVRDLEANVRPRLAIGTMVAAWPKLEAPS
ncbi:MAG TPA: DNA polymerase III subunit [Thermomicrobiales bacterium]|nr:DNA polymerase III subunit [Thermomicrobiales bacterium]